MAHDEKTATEAEIKISDSSQAAGSPWQFGLFSLLEVRYDWFRHPAAFYREMAGIHFLSFILVLAIIMVCATAFGSQLVQVSLTAEEKDWLGKNIKKIEFWYNDDFPPIQFSDENEEFMGMGADLFAMVEKRLGITVVKKRTRDWAGHLAALESGQCAIVPTIVQTPEIQKYMLFSSVCLKVPVVIIGPVTLGIGLSLKDLTGRKIAVVDGFAAEVFLKGEPEKRFRITPVENVLEGLRLAAFGQVDAFVGNLAVASYHISRQGITNLQVAGTTDYGFELRIGVSKKYPLLFSSIQKAVDAISAEELSAVRQRWITLQANHGLPPETMRLLVLSGLFLGLLVLGLSVIYLVLKRRFDAKMIRLDQAKQKDAQSEAGFQPFFENAPLPFGELDVKTGSIHFNRCFTDAFGYSDEDVPDLDAWWPQAYPDPEYRKEVQGEWEQAVSENRPIGLSQEKKECRISCKTGEVRNVVISAAIMRKRVLLTFFDISDLTHYQAELEKSLDRFQTLFDLLPFSCVINGMDGRYLLANKYFCDTTQKPLEQIVGRTMEELGRRVDPEAKERIAAEIKRNGSVTGVEMTVHHKGSTNHILFSSCLIDWKGETAILSSTVDITDRRKAKEALQKSQERLSLAFDAANDGLWDLDLDSEQMYCSPNYYKMLGYKPGDFPGTLEFWKQSLHPDDRIPAHERFLDYLAGRTNDYESEFRMQTRQGEWKWILSRGRIVERDESGSPVRVVGTHVDITEKKLAETALRNSEQNLRVTLNSIGDAVIATDIKGNVTRMNPIAQQLTGWTSAEAAGRPLPDVFHIVNAQTKDIVESPAQKVLSTGKIIDLANHTLLIGRNGAQYQIADSGSPIRNDSGEIIGVVLVFRDVTGEYEMQERLRQAQKMEAIGVLAGGIAHDFNNILSAVMGFTDLAKLEAGDNESIKRYLNSVSSAGLRARDLVRHILTFSRKTDVKKQPVYIDPIIKETLTFIRASLPANIDIRQDLRVKHARVWGDQTQIHQILMNLFINAGHAMKDKGGTLEVTMDTIVVGQTDTLLLKYIKPGRYFQLIVSDTGSGIPKTIIDRIFEPFFTTKKREEGTGMGLSTVYGILKEMGGNISVYSEVGVGTTFKVFIPEQQQANHTQKTLEPSLQTGDGRILIVDDEVSVMEGTREILSKLGYSVTGTASSHEALKKIKQNPRYFDLVLTDMTMPGMNGLELSRQIRAINPEIKIVLCTGFSQGLTKEMCTSAGILDLVMKPMIASELSMAVHNALKKSSKKEKNDTRIDH